MLTAKENLRQTVMDGGRPDRFVNNYEGVYLMMHPQTVHSGGLLAPGDMNVVNEWGITNSFPIGTPGAFPVHTPDKIVVKAIDEMNTELYGFTQQELEDARLDLQVLFG